AEYATVCTKLDPGDTLVLFSDGVTEAMDPCDQLFSVGRLREVLSGQQNTPLDEIQKKVLEAVENFAQGASQADDLTLLLIRFRAIATHSESDAPPAQTTSATA